MLTRPAMYDGMLQRQILPGDVVIGGELINSTLTTVGSGTILASQLISGIVSRTGPAGAFTDTTDTAANIINAALSNTYIASGTNTPGSVPNGTTFRVRYINTVAFAMTLAAGAGVTLGINTALAASSTKEYLVTITNGTITSVAPATVTNASAVVTAMTQAQTQLITVGMLVTGTNISAATTVISVQPGVGVTLSAVATGTATLNTLTFSPTVRIDSLGQMLL